MVQIWFTTYSNYVMYILEPIWSKNGGPSFQASKNINKKKWNGKIKPCPIVKSLLLSYGVGVFSKYEFFFAFIAT